MNNAFIRPHMPGHRSFTAPSAMFRRPSVSAASPASPDAQQPTAFEARAGGKVLR